MVTFDERGLDPPPDNSPMTFGKFAEVYKQRHVLAKGLALSSTIDYRLKPLVERFGDRPVAEIKTADIDDFVADLKRPRVVNGLEGRRLTPASINRTLGLLRHMLNWAVGREYLDRTPFRRGTEVLIRMELEDNKRRRRISESEEAALLAVASPHLRSMIIAALDTGMRRGEMLALRFGDIDWTRRMITLRGATTSTSVPIGTARLLAVLDGSGSTVRRARRRCAGLQQRGWRGLKTFKKAGWWPCSRHTASTLAGARALQGPLSGVSAAVSRHQPALARPEARVRLRLVERGVPLAQVRDLLGHASIPRPSARHQRREGLEGGKTFDPKIDASDKVSRIFKIHDELRSRRPRQGIRYKSLTACRLEVYRYGDSNPGPVAENHVS